MTVYTQDDPGFPESVEAVDDLELSVSWHHNIETVPTLIRADTEGNELERIVGWNRDQWQAFTGDIELGLTLPEFRPGCGSLNVDPGRADELLAKFGGTGLSARRVEFAALEDDIEAMYEQTRSRGLGREVKRRITIGTYVLSAGYYDEYYGSAQKARALITADFRAVFERGVDLLFTPTTPGPAFPLGERTDDPVRMYLSDVFTVTANLAGLPAASVPIGRVDGLPVGGQILAPRWEEERILAAASAVEAALPESAGSLA